MTAFYNEIDPYAAQWLRNLIEAGHIAPGVVDERSIEDITPNELAGFTQCHFFAGIGAWSHALRLAGWRDDWPVWTGSCPCQPFSTAGKGAGVDDERHLWPAWHHLIAERKPPIIFGEQVASKAGLGWLDVVRADLEAAWYAFGAADLCAAGVGAPHIRQRLYFVADSQGHRWQQGRRSAEERARSRDDRVDVGMEYANGERRNGRLNGAQENGWELRKPVGGSTGATCELAHSSSTGLERRNGRTLGHECAAVERGGSACALGDDDDDRFEGFAQRDERAPGRQQAPRGADAGRSGFWSDCDWIACRDGKARPVEPGTFPLAHGAPARVGRLRAYGNAIVPQVAAAFIQAACFDEDPIW